MASLCLLDEDGTVAGRWDLGESPVSVGRGESADVVIGDATLSRRHFVIARVGDSFVLNDLNSNNGTWVDGELAKATKLRHHDCILAGRTLFLFSEGGPPGTPSAKPGAVSSEPGTYLPLLQAKIQAGIGPPAAS
jgi:two-component system, NtrC family, sensor kinase